MNLMIHAIDAMKQAEGSREFAIKPQRGEAETEQPRVSVRDTGMGLPRQQADRILSPSFPTKPRSTGMGLETRRSVVEFHGGRLWAAGNSPGSACSYFSLPTASQAHDARGGAQPEPEPR
jgi:signal transduction histidine kinase